MKDKTKRPSNFVTGEVETDEERKHSQRLGALVLVASLFGYPILAIAGLALVSYVVFMVLKTFGLYP